MKLRLLALAVIMALGTAGLLAVHAWWLATGTRNARFVAFMRRHAQREHNSEVIPEHGRTLDCRGRQLDLALPGTVLQRAVDALALEAEGRPVKLSVDGDLQSRAEDLLRGKSGAVVVLEPTSGRIRALVSSPRVNYLDRALNGLYPPGSVFKVFMAGAALTSGLDPVYDCPASGYRSGSSTPAIRDVEAYQAERRGRRWKGFGRIGMGDALMHSSNVYFARLGVELGPERFGGIVAKARLREEVMVLPSPDVAVNSSGCGVPDGLRAPQLAPVAIGQGALQLTPLAVAMLTSAVADDGAMLSPTLLADAKPALRCAPFSFEAAGRVKRMMRGVVRDARGTGHSCEIPGLEVCGKTGTAQTGKGADHAWFTCFAPQQTPRLVVTVLVEHGGFGARAALPIAKELLLSAKSLGYFD